MKITLLHKSHQVGEKPTTPNFFQVTMKFEDN